MKRIVLLLATLLVWSVADHVKRRRRRSRSLFGVSDDSVAFPTRDTVRGIDLGDAEDVRGWCERLSCSADELRAAVAATDGSAAAVRQHLSRRR